MFKNLLKTVFRNITYKFGYSFLNILGMTLGITSGLFLIFSIGLLIILLPQLNMLSGKNFSLDVLV